MFKLNFLIIYTFLILFGFGLTNQSSTVETNYHLANVIDTPRNASSWPGELTLTNFATAELTPSPACLAVAATGEVFVGVDQIGSLGKDPGKGSIVKLIDNNNDGKIDKHTIFAQVDNPRGILALGNKVYVLYTTFSHTTKIATGMDLAVFEDKNNDGIADGPAKPLIQNISSPKFIQSRGTDHATNGIRMGIDGWIYIAAGDFGFHNAVDREGTKLTMHGGGVVRVRPDGTEMEIYSHGTRNIYDVAIDPLMNIFTRDNTNDGGGWNIRFSHQIQSGEYGYPLLFKNFTEEIIPGLVDVGGGSGTGSLFMAEPTWPDKYNNVPMMADWGNSYLYLHRVSPDGASFKQKDETFIKLSQITDLDVDGSGRLYLSAWDGAGYSGSPSKGFVVRATPKNWQYKAFPDLKKLSVKALAALLKSNSAVARLNAQEELLNRKSADVISASWAIAVDKSLPLYNRVAGIFTYAQAAGESGVQNLTSLVAEPVVKEFALRALADRRSSVSNVSVKPFLEALNDTSARVQAAAINGLGRLGRVDAISALLNVKVPSSFVAPAKNTEGPHAVPNSELILPHLAVRALVNLNAVDACVDAIGTKNSTLALWALRYMHNEKAVQGLISAYTFFDDAALKNQIINTLARLYKIEAPYKGTTWWNTRPDGHGPYYEAIDWESSPRIRAFIVQASKLSDASDKQFYTDLNEKYQMGISEFGGEEVLAKEESTIDLEKIRNKKGQIGESSIENIMLAMATIKGDAALGKGLFAKQGCNACHSLNKGEPLKGPFMGQIGSIMNREQIAESILKPDASISQGFATVEITAKGDKTYMGFITAESATRITLRDIAGQVTNIRTADVIKRKELETSMMPAGMANALSYEEFASLITFLSEQKK
ncbi:MAG: c-type cytochrome [Pedobacter sp.]|nr:MAG: c-type cytochrome [Pedobacter sp.]